MLVAGTADRATALMDPDFNATRSRNLDSPKPTLKVSSHRLLRQLPEAADQIRLMEASTSFDSSVASPGITSPAATPAVVLPTQDAGFAVAGADEIPARVCPDRHLAERVEPCSDKNWRRLTMDTNLKPHPPTLPARCLRIIVVSEVRFLREGLAEILKRDPTVSVVGLSADLPEMVALSPALRPDLVLLDAAYPKGVVAVKQTHDVIPDLHIVVFAVRETEEDIIAWAEAGAIGYVPNTAAVADLVRLVTSIHDGEQSCSARVAGGLLRRIALRASFGYGRNTSSPELALTPRERETAELIMIGLSDKEIARRLKIGVGTTKSHVHNLLGKLNVQRRGQVAAWWRMHAQHPGQVLGVGPGFAD
jgi:DNA-binding NarL/FixJ family response regulator